MSAIGGIDQRRDEEQIAKEHGLHDRPLWCRARIALQGPRRPGERLPDVELNVVEAVELSPPEDEEAIRWVLITSLPINELHEIRRIGKGLYKKR
ncbi:MAG: hypothetical protein U0892_09820 [Pirellulales bacterium]